MSRTDLLKRQRQRPFAPFRLVVSEGGVYDIRHPDQIMVARDSAVVGLKGEQEQDFFETTVLVDLGHIVRLEPLDTTSKTGSRKR
jgi:hypothetical protein